MRPFDKFKEIDARLAASEVEIEVLKVVLRQLSEAIRFAEPIASATIAPPSAKRRGRPPKPA